MAIVETAVLATAGEHLALYQSRVTGSVPEGGGDFEAEILELCETDAEGRFIAWVVFNADDRRAAAIEMRERFARSEEARSLPPALFESYRARDARDAVALRAALPDDFTADDRRRTGFGRIEGADAYVESVVALWEETRDLMSEVLYVVAIEPHGWLLVGRHFGTLRDGGEFEILDVGLFLFEGGRVVGFERYELEDLETARARFESLRPESARPDRGVG